MDSRKVLLLVGAVVIAVITALMARSLMMGTSAPVAVAEVKQVEGPAIAVATRALPVGTILDASAFKFQPWPKELVDGAYFQQKDTSVKSLIGTVVRNPITAGQPITQGVLIHPGDRGFLAAALGPGMRAVTVPVSAATAVAGFIFPGDHVDLVLTQSVPGGGNGPPLKVSETIIRNLRVLATDQNTTNPVGDDGKPVVHTFSNVTVECTPKMAEQISVARTIGDLSLSLRSLADDQSQLDEAIATGNAKVPDSDDPKAEQQMLAAADVRPIEGPTSYQTGGDVSRFQRSSVPGKAEDSAPPPMGSPTSGGAPVAATITGPTVRVARGTDVTIVPVGRK
ncbi:MAG: Flp pilus assembly protein CpaB [Sphingomonas sp.]